MRGLFCMWPVPSLLLCHVMTQPRPTRTLASCSLDFPATRTVTKSTYYKMGSMLPRLALTPWDQVVLLPWPPEKLGP